MARKLAAVAGEPVNEAAEALRRARGYIGTPERWTQRFFARDKHGNFTYPYKDDAVCFCALGAVNVENLPKGVTNAMHGALYAVLAKLEVDSIAEYNDDPERTHKEILALFDAAIEILEAA